MYILHPDFIAINVWLCTFIIIVSQWITLKHECPKKINLGQQPEWTNLINKESGTIYYNVSIVTPIENHIFHNGPTINMKAIQCRTTQYSVRLLYLLFCPAALIDSPPNCHWPSLEVTFAQSGQSSTLGFFLTSQPG